MFIEVRQLGESNLKVAREFVRVIYKGYFFDH